MILKLLYLPIRIIHVFSVLIGSLFQYVYSNLLPNKHFDLGLFYQVNLERLGGTFIKIGQILSVRYDILPEEQCNALAKLQDNVKSFNPEKGIKIIHNELGGAEKHGIKNISGPFAAGSLCQVYKATYIDGTTLAIKVKRPLIEAKLFADIIFLKLVKYMLILTGVGKKIGAHRLVDEIIDVLKNELDYKKEARHLELFVSISLKIKNLVVPKIYPKLSTNTILTMDFLEGLPLSEFITKYKDDEDYDKNTLCKKIYDVYIQCIFDMGTFHADAHPGNIFILPDGKIGLVDFGIIGILNGKMKQKNFNYLLALANGDTELAATIFADILISNQDSNKEELLRDTKIELDLYLSRLQNPDSGIAEKSSASLYTNSMVFARKYNFTFPENVFLFYKTLFTLDSVILKIHSGFDSKKQTKHILEQLSKDKLVNELSYSNVVSKIQQLPVMISSVPELISQVKTFLDHQNSGYKHSSGMMANEILNFFSITFIILGILFPILFYTQWIEIAIISNWKVILISILTILTGLRLKQ